MKQSYNIDIPDIIRQTYSVYYLVGKWTNKDGITIWQYFCFIYYVLLLLSVSMGSVSAGSTEEKVYLTVTTFVGAVQMCRMYCLMWKQKEILDLTHATRYHITNDYVFFARCTTKMKILTFLAKLCIFILFGALVVVIFLPVGSGERNLIFSIAFPLNYKNSEGAFWIAHAFVSFGYFLSAISCCFMYIVWYLMLNLVLKYDILGNQFINLSVKTEEMQPRRKIMVAEADGLYMKQFIEAIKDHEKIHKYTE